MVRPIVSINPDGTILHPFQPPPTHRLTGPTSTSHRRTIWTGRSPHRFLSPFHADATRHDRCDHPHLSDFLAAVLPFCSNRLVRPVLTWFHHLFSFCKSCPPSHCVSPHPPPHRPPSCRSPPTYPWPPFLLVPTAANRPPSHICAPSRSVASPTFVTAVRR